jgi:hypothetical protein
MTRPHKAGNVIERKTYVRRQDVMPDRVFNQKYCDKHFGRGIDGIVAALVAGRVEPR